VPCGGGATASSSGRPALLKHLTADGLFPADPGTRAALQALDPFVLRARALDEKLTLHEIGRALFHIDQRRGFKSNRKTDRADDEETGKIAVGIERLRQAIDEAGARTYGEFLHRRRASAASANEIPTVRARLTLDGDGYDFYPGRALLEEEFEAILEAQATHHPAALTEPVRARLFEIVFHQRPLKKPRVGLCSLLADGERLAKAHPLFQRRRLLEEVNALMVTRPGEAATPLTKEQRDILVLKLKDQRKASFAGLRKALKLPKDARFNKETDTRKDLAGDEIAAEFGKPDRFGHRWRHLTWQQQWEIVSHLSDVESDKDAAGFRAWLMTRHKLDEPVAQAVLKVRLPSGHGRFGETATVRLIAALEQEVIVYSAAVEKAGLPHHSDFRTGEIIDALPYYGETLERFVMPGTGNPDDPPEQRIGKLTNPTVHIGLNQVRRVVNELIRAYGTPAEIAIELARELKLTEDEKANRNRENAANRKAAERRSTKLVEEKQTDNGANRARLKLWEELNPDNVLDRRCIYSGRQISIDMLFSDAVEVDHILPFSETFDDSNGNRILALREANRLKRKRTPHEARADFRARFGEDAEWEAIAARAARLPKEKRWRFEPDAMQRFDKTGGFLARQLVDTQYLGRLAGEYLRALYPEKGEGSGKVWVSPGRMTEMVRRKLGLNDLLPDHNFGGGADQPKNRKDHRHHAIDAFVVGIVDRSLLQRIARASGQGGADERERVKIPDPWEGYRDELKKALDAIVVAHRQDHGTYSKAGLNPGRDATAGKLHNETAYGLTGEKDAKGNDLIVSRQALGALKKRADIADPKNLSAGVRDPDLRQALLDFVGDREGKDFEARIREFPRLGPLPYRGIRRVRIIEPLEVIPIRDRNGVAYKGYKGDSNARYDVWELKDGKWVAEVVSTFDAHQPGWRSPVRAAHPTARKVLSLVQNDTVMYEPEGKQARLMHVVKFRQDGQVTLAELNEAGYLKARDALPSDIDPFKYTYGTAGSLRKAKVRQVRVDVLGRVSDPGFPARKAIRRTKSKPV
jgi:CRISPR-associated endonuclease Csn1